MVTVVMLATKAAVEEPKNIRLDNAYRVTAIEFW